MSNNLTDSRLLARNTLWNLVGECAPLLVAVIAIPKLVHAMGTDRFGILMLVWLMIGYLSLFDLGVGRALTNLVSQKLGSGEDTALPPLIWTAILLMFGVAFIGSLLLASAAHWIVYSFIRVPDELRREALQSLYILSATLPAVICTTGFRGVLEAYQRFGAANAIRIPMGIFSYAAPLAILPFSHSLVPIVCTLAFGRYAALLAHVSVCQLLVPLLRSGFEWDSLHVRPLLSFGGWMTVSNIAAPIMTGMDRFFLGALVSLHAVAYYATPYEVVMKVLVIPTAISGVVFPAFSTSLGEVVGRAREIYRQAQGITAIVIVPIIAAIIVGSHFGLRLWLGDDFADQSSLVLQILSVGVLLNGLTYTPVALVQGASRPDWVAKMHIVELPFYLLTFWLLTIHLGIVGTALAWLLRAIVEFTILLILVPRVFDQAGQAVQVIEDLDASSLRR